MVCLIDYYLNAGGKTIMDNAYGYDVVSNVLSVVNKAAIPEKGKAGGQMSYNYTYDALYRLSTASGTYKGADNKAASYTLSMGYDNMHRITSKKQHLSQTGVQFEGTLNAGYELAYTYGKDAGRKFQLDNVRDINYRTEETPTESMNINNGHKYTYDLNGNLVYINTSRVKRDGKEDEKATEQKYRWDEENRLMVLSDNSKTSRYTYNAAGERIMKSYGTMEGVYINGAPQGITLTNVDFRLHQDKMSKLFCAWFALKFHETDNFTLYPASILSVNKNRFTKHYFIGDKRVASRIGTGLFNNVYGRNGSYVTAGQQDYAERMNQIQKQKEAYYKQQGIAPGVPTMKGAYGDPENTKRGYNSIIDTLGNHDVPQGWIQTPRPNTTPNTNPGPPVSWNDPSNPDDPQAGYGYIPNDTTKEETFFYHSDHLGSTSYITDDKANITQYDAYLPYGELLVDEHSSSEDLPYKFNGKQFDEETGLYYYGARYMNPVASIWYGVDVFQENKADVASYLYCFGNPINLTDPDGNWERDRHGNLIAQKGDNAVTYAKYTGISNKESLKILLANGITINSKGVLSLKVGDVIKNNGFSRSQNILKNESTGNDIPNNSNQTLTYGKYKFNINAAVRTLNKNANSHSLGKCAKYVRLALEGGGFNTAGHPVDAKNYNHFLRVRGWQVVSTSQDFQPLKGDIAVFRDFQGDKRYHSAGHIQMFNGNRWISDFRQNGFWAGGDYRRHQPSFVILRFGRKE